ncbi:hypothetical protein V6N11_043089 [Hibiscus sabdariffa]|uniref:Uncharacterized protein n=1 Tax=Hibiscus sabdariffa TaxID=183260 RepID=A0ABR2QYV4_9ROSI
MLNSGEVLASDDGAGSSVWSVSLDVMPPLMVSRRAGEASVHANPSASPGSDSRVAGHTVADVVGSAGDVDECLVPNEGISTATNCRPCFFSESPLVTHHPGVEDASASYANSASNELCCSSAGVPFVDATVDATDSLPVQATINAHPMNLETGSSS